MIVRLYWNPERKLLNWEAEGETELAFVSAISCFDRFSCTCKHTVSQEDFYFNRDFLDLISIIPYMHFDKERFIP